MASLPGGWGVWNAVGGGAVTIRSSPRPAVTAFPVCSWAGRNPPLPAPRLVAAFGLTRDQPPPRQPSLMRGLPLPPAPMPIDRGRVIASTSGGAEGIGLNLIPQNRALNRGIGREGRRWRAGEAGGSESRSAGVAEACVRVCRRHSRHY